MKRFLLLCIALGICTEFAYSQGVSNEMICFAIDQYVNENVDTSIIQNVYIYVISGEKITNYRLGNTKITLFDSTNDNRYFRKLIKSDGAFYSLKIDCLNNDTVDVVFCKCHVSKINKHYWIVVEDGGDSGYIPFARFIYSQDSKVWNYISYDKLRTLLLLKVPQVVQPSTKT